MEGATYMKKQRSIEIIEQLKKNGSVTCPFCKKGTLKPINEKTVDNNCYECDKCNNYITLN